MVEIEEIKICIGHQEEEIIPLVWTFAFDGSEYWCPGCGYNGGMFGAGEKVQNTKEFKKSAKEWKEKTKEFLAAKSASMCSSLIWEGKRMSPNDLPETEKNRLAEVIEKWEYKYE